MASYWYKVELARGLTMEQRKKVKAELRRLFRSSEMPLGEGLTFELTSPLGPRAAHAALARFEVKYGSAAITSGSKLE
jgi:hypothetical protein